MSELLLLLTSKKTGDVRKAAKLLQKDKNVGAEETVLKAFLIERTRKNSWETQVELIKAIGINEYRSSSNILEEIADKNEEYDMITIAAGTALIRLKRKD